MVVTTGVTTRPLYVSGRKSKLLWIRSNSSARSNTAEMCRPSHAFACNAESSEYPVGAVPTRRALVTESAVANNVTSTPRLTSPSVKSDANCSQGPYSRGGTRQEIGARTATRKVPPERA